jgi:hypothetical protein
MRFPRPQARPAGVVACEGQRSAARRWLVIRFRERRQRRGWIEPPSARPVALRQRRFESSGPRFCHAGLCSRRGLASSSRRDRSVPKSVPEASRERGATLARRRRPHPAKRHASGWPPLGDGMAGIIREVRRAGISLRAIPQSRWDLNTIFFWTAEIDAERRLTAYKRPMHRVRQATKPLSSAPRKLASKCR